MSGATSTSEPKTLMKKYLIWAGLAVAAYFAWQYLSNRAQASEDS